MLARLKQHLPVTFLRRLAPLWVACLIVGSLLPGEAKIAIGSSRLSEQHLTKQAGLPNEWQHRAFHIAGFGATAFLFLAIARSSAEELFSMAGLVLLGAGVECAQVLVYANCLETEDIRDDAYGIIAMYAVWLIAALLDRRKLDAA